MTNLESKKSRKLTGPWMELHGVSKSFPREVSLSCLCDLVIAHWILDFGRKYAKWPELHLELTESAGRIDAAFGLKVGGGWHTCARAHTHMHAPTVCQREITFVLRISSIWLTKKPRTTWIPSSRKAQMWEIHPRGAWERFFNVKVFCFWTFCSFMEIYHCGSNSLQIENWFSSKNLLISGLSELRTYFCINNAILLVLVYPGLLLST